MTITKPDIVTKESFRTTTLPIEKTLVAADVNEIHRAIDDTIDVLTEQSLYANAPLLDRYLTVGTFDSVSATGGRVVEAYTGVEINGLDDGAFIICEFASASYTSGALITFDVNAGDDLLDMYFNMPGGASAFSIDIPAGFIFDAAYLIATRGTMQRIGNYVVLRNVYLEELTEAASAPWNPGPATAFIREMVIPFVEV